MDKDHDVPTQEQERIAYNFQDRKNYGGGYEINGEPVRCYTKKQVKSLYPEKDYKTIAEYVPNTKKKTIGSLLFNKMDLALSTFGSHSRLLYREKGYVSIEEEEDGFVVLLKNAVLTRAIVLAVCLGLITGGIVLAQNMDKLLRTIPDEDIAAGSRGLDLEEGAVDWEGVQSRDTGGVTTGIAIPGYKSITIDADTTKAEVNFVNPEGNPCYFIISLLLDDGTVLYQSKMVEPGKGLYEITLSRPLEPGEYGATVKYETLSLTDLSPLNGAEVKISLIAE